MGQMIDGLSATCAPCGTDRSPRRHICVRAGRLPVDPHWPRHPGVGNRQPRHAVSPETGPRLRARLWPACRCKPHRRFRRSISSRLRTKVQGFLVHFNKRLHGFFPYDLLEQLRFEPSLQDCEYIPAGFYAPFHFSLMINSAGFAHSGSRS